MNIKTLIANSLKSVDENNIKNVNIITDLLRCGLNKSVYNCYFFSKNLGINRPRSLRQDHARPN